MNVNAITPKRGSKLKGVKPVDVPPRRPQILLYGSPGVGKTYFATAFPHPYYIDTEGGATRKQYVDRLKNAGGAYFGIDEGATSFEAVLDQVKALATEEHDFQTLVIDSVTKIFNGEIANEAERLGEKDAFGASKKPATSFMRRLVNWIVRLDMNVVLIAHEKANWISDGKGGRTEGPPIADVWGPLSHELDLVMNTMRRGPGRVARITKTRIDEFPDQETIPLDFEEFVTRYGRDAIYRQTQALALATPEQVAEIERLLGIVKLPEGTADKWLASAKAAEWNEVDADKADKVIAALRAKIEA
jgi:hypothetical protein